MGQTERTAPVDTKKRQLQVHDQAETWRVHHGLRWTAGPDLPPTTERHGANWSVRSERSLLMSPLLRWCRALAAMSLVVLLSGLIFWAYLEGWVYLDGPEAEKTAGRLQLSLWTVLPGLVLAVIVWGLTLLGLARVRRWRGFALVLLPLVPIVADVIAGPFFHFDPASPDAPANRALDLMILSGWVLSGLLLVLCFALREGGAQRRALGSLPMSDPPGARSTVSPPE